MEEREKKEKEREKQEQQKITERESQQRGLRVGIFFLSGSEREGGGGIGLLASVCFDIVYSLVFLIFFLTKIRILFFNLIIIIS